MRKVICFFGICFLFLFNINIIQAHTYTCAYDFKVETGIFGWFSHNSSIEFTVDTENKTISWPEKLTNNYEVYFLDQYFDEKFTVEYIIDSLNDGCVSSLIVGPLANEVGYAIFFEESHTYQLEEASSLAGGGYHLPPEFLNDYQQFANITQLAKGTLNESESSGKTVKGMFKCSYFTKTMDEIKNLDLTDLSDKQVYNAKKDNLKSFCQNVLKSANVGTSYCINPCLELSEQLAKIEKTDNEEQVCGFSDNLIIWIANIIRWVKYIVPVIVIVLGIIDFIRAVAADKDDEMKKAQGRFIKRLIAAALIFIVPFIIEFVLDKMGFTSNGCGIINL